MPEFSHPTPVTADIRLSAGSLEVHTEPRDTVLVEVTPGDSSDAARELAASTRVELTGETLMVAAPDSNGWPFRRNPPIRVIARVPAGSSGRIRVGSADVTCHGRWAAMRLNTISGDVFVEQVDGDLTVNSASGDVRAGDVTGRLTVHSASGAVTAGRVDGPVDVKSASGDLEVDELGAGLVGHTASGDVRVGAAHRGTVKVTSASGDSTVGVRGGTAVWLDLNTVSGRTRSGLDHRDSAPPNGHELTIQVRTLSGDIDIRRA